MGSHWVMTNVYLGLKKKKQLPTLGCAPHNGFIHPGLTVGLVWLGGLVLDLSLDLWDSGHQGIALAAPSVSWAKFPSPWDRDLRERCNDDGCFKRGGVEIPKSTNKLRNYWIATYTFPLV